MSLRLSELLRFRPALIAFAGFCGALLVHLFEMTEGIGNTLEGPHDFRQAQTALTTYHLLQDGLTINYETPVFGSPATIPFEFPTYQFAVVGVYRLLGGNLDVAGRLTSIAFFYATLPLIALTLRRLQLPWTGIWLGLGALLVSPVYLFYTRAFLIESTALFTSWAFLLALAVLLYREPPAPGAAHDRRWRGVLLALVLVAGIVAAVTKVTTFAIHAAAAVLLWLAFHRQRLRLFRNSDIRRWLRNHVVCLGLVFAVILVAALAWIHHTDALKLSNPSPIPHRLTSAALSGWNFGYAGQWAKLDTWLGLTAHFLSACVASFYPLGLVAIFLSMIQCHRAVTLALLLAFLTGPVLFTNLFHVHDYYWYANTVFLSLACGLTVGTFLLKYLANHRIPQLVLVAAFLLPQALAYHYSGYHLLQKAPPHETVPLAETLRQHTAPESSLVIFGCDWNSMIPYCAQRRAFMVPWDNELFFDAGSQQAIATMVAAGHPVGAVVFGGETATDMALQARVLHQLSGRFTRVHGFQPALIFIPDPDDDNASPSASLDAAAPRP